MADSQGVNEVADVAQPKQIVLPNADETKSRRRVMTSDIVFIKLVPSGKLFERVMEAAYVMYNPKTRARQVKSFLFYHPASHSAYKDTFADYHMAPTEGDGRSLSQLCKDKTVATAKIQDFCQAFTDDLTETFGRDTRHITFVGDHIWQTRSLLYPFMFCQNPWIRLPSKRQLIHFVEYRTFMQPFAVMHTQMAEPFELPQWVFRARADVNAQVNYFDSMIQMALRRSPFDEKDSSETQEPGQVEDDGCEHECDSVCAEALACKHACCDNQECANYAPSYCGQRSANNVCDANGGCGSN